MNYRSLPLVFFVVVLAAADIAFARSADMKKPCVNCHTMHNSQDGKVPEITTPSLRTGGSGMPQGALLNTSCYGCHSDAISHVDTPVVLHFNAPTYDLTGTDPLRNTLAGGDFYWVSGGSSPLKGHDVAGIVTPQYTRTPPGGNTSVDTLTCAGTSGCHGLNRTSESAAMYQTHHAVETAQPRDGSPLSESYRWLDGVAGYEDSDYELSVSSSDHNQYKGVARSGDTDEPLSITHFCAKCHSNYHYGSGNLGVWDGSTTFGSDPWIRHPVDVSMSLTGEFANYGGTGNAYNIATPVGSDVVSTVKATVSGAGDTIITCISCHRAHGSPYDYSLRWDYKNWPGGVNSYNGCGDCHTAKN